MKKITEEYIVNALNNVLEENDYVIVNMDHYSQVLEKKLIKKDEIERITQQVRTIEIKNKLEIDDIDLLFPTEIEFDFLNKLLNDGFSTKEIKKINIGHNYGGFLNNWNKVIDKVRHYKENNLKEKVIEITKKYTSKIDNYDLDFLIELMSKENNFIELISIFYKNHEELLTLNQKDYITDLIKEKRSRDGLSSCNKIHEKLEDINIFEEKENTFEYLNINAESLLKKYKLSKSNISSIKDYEKVLRDTISFVKENKKEIGISDIYIENRVNKENDFLILIRKQENFRLDFLKKIMIAYMKMYIEKLHDLEKNNSFNFKSDLESNLYQVKGNIADKKKTLFNYVELEDSIVDKPKVKSKTNKI